jgi:CMP-N-acetylneuraminic acid synthetase
MNNNKKILGVILARGGSKQIPKKNIALLNNIPLIAYTIVEAKKSKYVSDLVVSSDDDEIRKVSVQFGAEAPFKRPDHLSGDAAKPVECDLHATKFMEKKNNMKYDYVVELLCTNPFKTSFDIDEAIKIQIKSDADSVIGVMRLDDHHPIRIKKIENGYIKNFCFDEIPESRRQDLKPDAYIRNGSIYSMRRDMIEKGIRYGTENSLAYVMPRERTLNIDEPMDLVIADLLMKQNPRNYILKSASYKDATKIIEK